MQKCDLGVEVLPYVGCWDSSLNWTGGIRKIYNLVTITLIPKGH